MFSVSHANVIMYFTADKAYDAKVAHAKPLAADVTTNYPPEAPRDKTTGTGVTTISSSRVVGTDSPSIAASSGGGGCLLIP